MPCIGPWVLTGKGENAFCACGFLQPPTDSLSVGRDGYVANGLITNSLLLFEYLYLDPYNDYSGPPSFLLPIRQKMVIAMQETLLIGVEDLCRSLETVPTSL